MTKKEKEYKEWYKRMQSMFTSWLKTLSDRDLQDFYGWFDGQKDSIDAIIEAFFEEYRHRELEW
jgi:hypothetical protein